MFGSPAEEILVSLLSFNYAHVAWRRYQGRHALHLELRLNVLNDENDALSLLTHEYFSRLSAAWPPLQIPPTLVSRYPGKTIGHPS